MVKVTFYIILILSSPFIFLKALWGWLRSRMGWESEEKIMNDRYIIQFQRGMVVNCQAEVCDKGEVQFIPSYCLDYILTAKEPIQEMAEQMKKEHTLNTAYVQEVYNKFQKDEFRGKWLNKGYTDMEIDILLVAELAMIAEFIFREDPTAIMKCHDKMLLTFALYDFIIAKFGGNNGIQTKRS